MAYLMGIDIGTSSLKTIIIDECGNVKSISARSYQYDSPHAGYAEQDPEVWWRACVETVREALAESGIKGEDIKGVGFSGQMHGAVLLDKDLRVIRPAILHCDARSGEQVRNMNKILGYDRICNLVLNPIYTGFLLTSLIWVRDNEPHNYDRVYKVCLPKDYIKLKFTGMVTSDFSDASATMAFDIKNNCWSEEILNIFKISPEIFPECFDTDAVVGYVSAQAAGETGLSISTAVVAGGGDQVMQSIGNGVTDMRTATANIGSSGQVCYQSNQPITNRQLSTNTFCGFKRGRWIVMGAIMHAGLSLKWFNGLFEKTDYMMLDAQAAKVPPGSGGLIFLPYLNGERTPHINPNLSAMFIGCNISTGRAEMARSVMEGVSFAMMQCMEVCEQLGLNADSVVASGGGAHSPLWLQIQSDVYGLPLRVADTDEQASLGAAIAAGAGTGIFNSIEDGCKRVVRYKKAIVEPNMDNHSIYRNYYSLFKDAYKANKAILERVTIMGRSV
ncbi:MAG: xylulokinase [Oscillospiraceae bacterium]